MIQWFVIITIGCIPIDEQIEQFGEQTCFFDTSVIESQAANKASAEHIVDTFADELMAKVPGSFATARLEKREKEKKNGKGQ